MQSCYLFIKNMQIYANMFANMVMNTFTGKLIGLTV